MDHIIRNFYLGNEEDSRNIELLKQNNIRCIINCAIEIPNTFPGIFWYLNLPLEDPDSNIEKYFGTILHQFEIAQNFPTLIHCRMGISRSATSLIYFLSQTLNLPWQFLLLKIKEARPIVEPHPFFKEILTKSCLNIC